MCTHVVHASPHILLVEGLYNEETGIWYLVSQGLWWGRVLLQTRNKRQRLRIMTGWMSTDLHGGPNRRGLGMKHGAPSYDSGRRPPCNCRTCADDRHNCCRRGTVGELACSDGRGYHDGVTANAAAGTTSGPELAGGSQPYPNANRGGYQWAHPARCSLVTTCQCSLNGAPRAAAPSLGGPRHRLRHALFWRD